ncbi:hypothetical protein V8B97DRAFT_1867006 [Scleroderma yunnanense]
MLTTHTQRTHAPGPTSPSSSRPIRSSPLSGPVLSRVPSAASRPSRDGDDNSDAIDRIRSAASSTVSFSPPAPESSSSSSSLPIPRRPKSSDGDRTKDKSHTASALNFFRRPPSTVGHSSVGHSTASHSTSSATTHSSILTHATTSTSTQLTQYSNSSSCVDDSLPLPPPAHIHSRATSLPSLPGSRPVSFAGTSSSLATGVSSGVKRPISVTRSHSSTPASPSTLRKSTLNPASIAHKRSRTSTNADNWNPLWASTLSDVPTSPPVTKVLPSAVPSKASPATTSIAKSPFGPAEIPRFSRATLRESGVVMPISAKEYRRRQSIVSPSDSVAVLGTDTPTGRIDKAKGKERDLQWTARQRVSFVDGVGGGVPRPFLSQQQPLVPPVEVRVHPPSPTSPTHLPETTSPSPSQTPDIPDVTITLEPEQNSPPQELHTLSPKSSTTSFTSCTSSAFTPSSASPTRATFVPPLPPTVCSVFPSTDTSGDEKCQPQVPAARPRPRKRHQSSPQNETRRLSFVDAMMRLSVGSLGSFVTASSGASGNSNTDTSGDEKIKHDSSVKIAGENGVGKDERDVLPRARSLDGLATSSRRSFPPPMPGAEPVLISVPPSLSGGGPNATVDPAVSAGIASDALASDVDADVRRRQDVSRSMDMANRDPEQSIPVPLTTSIQVQAQPPQSLHPPEQQRKKKLTKARPASVHSSSVPTVPSSPAPAFSPAHATSLAPYNPHKHAPTVLSPIIEDGSSHGHSSSHGHGHEQEHVRPNGGADVPISFVEGRNRSVVDVSTVARMGQMKEDAPSTKASTSPTKANASSTKTKASSTKAGILPIKGSPSSTKSDSPRGHSKRYSFLIPGFPFRKSREPKSGEVRDGVGAECPITSETYIKSGAGSDRDSPKKGGGGKMRKKRGVESTVNPPPVAESVGATASDLDANISNSNLGIVGLPHGNSEITLVASHSPCPPPSPSPSSLLALPHHPSVFGSSSVPGSAASSIRIHHATASAEVNDVKGTETKGDIVKAGIEVIVHADDTAVTKNVNLCLAHRLSHSHLFEKGVVPNANDSGKLRPTSVSVSSASSRPGTSSSTLTTSSDDASFSTVLTMHFPNPWDTIPLAQGVMRPLCPMCGRCGPPMPPPLPPIEGSLPLPLSVPLPIPPRQNTGDAMRYVGSASPIPPPPLQMPHTRAQTWAPTHSNSVSPPPSTPCFQPSPGTSPTPVLTHSPRKLKRPQTAPGVPRSKKVDGMTNMNASASVVHLTALPKVEKESRVKSVLKGWFGIMA